MTSKVDGHGGAGTARLRRSFSFGTLGHGCGPILAATAAAALGLGPPDVTSAVWLDTVPACGASLFPAWGREAATMASMAGLVLAGHGIGGVGVRSWRAIVGQTGLMALLHLALMLCDDVSRHAGSVPLGRDLRAAVLAGLVAAPWVCRGESRTASTACAVRCGSVMTAVMLAAALPWSLAGMVPLALLIAGLAPDAPMRERWTSAFGFAGVIAVAGWG